MKKTYFKFEKINKFDFKVINYKYAMEFYKCWIKIEFFRELTDLIKCDFIKLSI